MLPQSRTLEGENHAGERESAEGVRATDQANALKYGVWFAVFIVAVLAVGGAGLFTDAKILGGYAEK